MISDSDLIPAYEPLASCDHCGTVLQHGKCPVCQEDDFYESDRALYEGDDSLTEAIKDTARDVAFLDMTPWGPGPALAKRQAD